MSAPTIPQEIDRYLRTGEADPMGGAWPGRTILDTAKAARRDLLAALGEQVQLRTEGQPPLEALDGLDVVALTRRKVEPMVNGLFPEKEREAVLSLLDRSVVFLTPQSIEKVLGLSSWLHTSWLLANVYLASVGAELLGDDAPQIVGLSEETTCYVSPAYFNDGHPFSDFVVHEVAHIFHNCKRGTAGLKQTRKREWLLNIDFRKRETFAYSCEAYAKVIERAPRFRDRVELAKEFGEAHPFGGTQIDPEEVVDIVTEAAPRRNGWKIIRARCAPPRPAKRIGA